MEKDEYKFSIHLRKKIATGKVNVVYVEETVNAPDKVVEVEDDEMHLFKKILRFGNRCFKVVVNPLKKLIVTAYFDRKMTKNGCK